MNKCWKADSKVRSRTNIFPNHSKPEEKSCFGLLFSSCRRYSPLDKQDLSTPLLEGGQKFLHFKKHLKPRSKQEFSNQRETAPSMQINIIKHPNKMTLRGAYARIGQNSLRKLLWGGLSGRSPSRVPALPWPHGLYFGIASASVFLANHSLSQNQLGPKECVPTECECYNWPLYEPSWKSGGAPALRLEFTS